MHHSIARGSIARAPAALPISAVSQPNDSSTAVTSAFAPSLLPQINIVGRPSEKEGFTISVLPTEQNDFTKCASGARACSRSIRDSPGPVKYGITPSTGGAAAMGLVVSMTVL